MVLLIYAEKMFKLILTVIWAILGCAGGMHIAQYSAYMLPAHGAILGLVIAIALKFMLEE